MLWLEKSRIPKGQWPFLSSARAGLVEIEGSLAGRLDLTEGTGSVLMTGCVQMYRQAVLRRVLDLAQATAASWNVGMPIGAIVCSRSLLETIATFHSFLTRADAAASICDWETIGKLLDAYSFSTASGSNKRIRTPEHPPRIGKIVVNFIKATQPGQEQFWEQVCNVAHPNGRRMLGLAGDIREERYYYARGVGDNEPELFAAVFNCLFSCCWLIASETDFDILLERIRTGGDLPPDHELIVRRNLIESVTERVARKLRPFRPGPAKKISTRGSR